MAFDVNFFTASSMPHIMSTIGNFLVATLKSNPFDNNGTNSFGISTLAKFNKVFFDVPLFRSMTVYCGSLLLS